MLIIYASCIPKYCLDEPGHKHQRLSSHFTRRRPSELRLRSRFLVVPHWTRWVAAASSSVYPRGFALLSSPWGNFYIQESWLWYYGLPSFVTRSVRNSLTPFLSWVLTVEYCNRERNTIEQTTPSWRDCTCDYLHPRRTLLVRRVGITIYHRMFSAGLNLFSLEGS
jgi:hypothetical protein